MENGQINPSPNYLHHTDIIFLVKKKLRALNPDRTGWISYFISPSLRFFIDKMDIIISNLHCYRKH